MGSGCCCPVLNGLGFKLNYFSFWKCKEFPRRRKFQKIKKWIIFTLLQLSGSGEIFSLTTLDGIPSSFMLLLCLHMDWGIFVVIVQWRIKFLLIDKLTSSGLLEGVCILGKIYNTKTFRSYSDLKQHVYNMLFLGERSNCLPKWKTAFQITERGRERKGCRLGF